YANTARAYAAGELCEKQKPRGLGVAMARKAKFSVAPSDARFNRGHTDPARGFSWVDPEEGYRLMGAFLSIKQPTLREAVVKMVTELSIPDDERRTLVKSISIRSSIYFCPETKTPRGVFLLPLSMLTMGSHCWQPDMVRSNREQ